MAIDTRNKRASAISPASPWRGLWPAPDGTVDAADRATSVFLYSGFMDGGAPPDDDVIQYPTRGIGVGVSVSIRMGTR